MNRSDIVAATTPVADAFELLGVPYYIGGSVASSVHGIARATLDVDMVVGLLPSHVQPLLQWLQNDYYADEGMIREAIKEQSCFNLIHLETMLKLDIYILKERAFDQESFRRRRLDTLEDTTETRQFYLGSAEVSCFISWSGFGLAEKSQSGNGTTFWAS